MLARSDPRDGTARFAFYAFLIVLAGFSLGLGAGLVLSPDEGRGGSTSRPAETQAPDIAAVTVSTLPAPASEEAAKPPAPTANEAAPAPATDIPRAPLIAGRYQVQPGDTLSSIANRFDTTIEAFSAANSLDQPNLIIVGQTLVIPGQSGAAP